MKWNRECTIEWGLGFGMRLIRLVTDIMVLDGCKIIGPV